MLTIVDLAVNSKIKYQVLILINSDQNFDISSFFLPFSGKKLAADDSKLEMFVRSFVLRSFLPSSIHSFIHRNVQKQNNENINQ